jgi:gliding motility-associated-like protein
MSLRITPAPTVFLETSNACADEDGVQLNANFTVAGGVQWTSDGSGIFAPGDRSNTPTYIPAPIDYIDEIVTITATTTDNGTCRPVRDEANILVTPLPPVEAGENQIICRGTSTTLTGFSPSEVSYLWFNQEGDTLSTENIAQAIANNDTSFTLEVRDVRGCTNQDTVLVIPVDPPSFNMIEQVCFDYGLPLDGEPSVIPVNGQFQWFRNDTLLSNEVNTTTLIRNSGEHVIRYFYGRCQVSESAEVSPLPEVLLTDKTICEGANTDLIGNFIEGATYIWREENQTVGTNDTVTITTDANQYYRLEITDTLGCVNEDSMLVETIPPPQLTLSDTAGCVGDPLTLTGTPTVTFPGVETYTWTREEEIIGTEATLTVLFDGRYALTYRVGECVTEDTSEVTFNTKPEPENEDEVEFCLKYDPGALLDAGPGTGYRWHSDNSNNQTTLVTEQDYYRVDIFNGFGCFTTDSIFAQEICKPEPGIPNAIMLNSPIEADRAFYIQGTEFITKLEITIFNRWGEVVYFSDDKDFRWEAFYKGDLVQGGVYNYVIEYEGQEQFRGPFKVTGQVTVIR